MSATDVAPTPPGATTRQEADTRLPEPHRGREASPCLPAAPARGWIAVFACSHRSEAAAADGHVYSMPRRGQWLTCNACQGQRKVADVLPAFERQEALW